MQGDKGGCSWELAGIAEFSQSGCSFVLRQCEIPGMLQLCVMLLGHPVLLGQLRFPGAAASLWCAAAQRLLATPELQGSRNS